MHDVLCRRPAGRAVLGLRQRTGDEVSMTRTTRATLLLSLLFFFGLTVTVLAFIDLRWTHLVLVRELQ
jgi:hypothetical protein